MDQSNLKLVWDLVKNGANKKYIMQLFKCSKEEATEMYNQASHKYGLGPYFKKKPTVPLTNEQNINSKKVERPAARYSNSGYLKFLNQY